MDHSDDYVDIGHNVAIRVRDMPEGTPYGVEYLHPCTAGVRREGWIPLSVAVGAFAGWELVSREPLTLSPSIRCRACGHHGFIRGGRWEPA